MNKEIYLHIIFGVFAIIIWFVPEHSDLKIKLLISSLIVLSVALIIFKEKLFIFRRYWQEMISVVLLASSFLFFKNTFPEMVVPATIIVLVTMTITFLMSFKYRQGFVYRSKVLLRNIAINNLWRLNHWGSTCASIVGDKMVFVGTSAPNGADGSHIDLNKLLEIGKTYEISCFAKTDTNTTGQFQLWCHDQTGETPCGATAATPYKTPSTKGEIISLNFTAEYNQNIRIHLQYTPGQGRIEISNVNIYRLNA